jgi:glyoxylase-like metal-dependent hydrolase (beta-lactamase superfamily II)
LVRNGLYVTGFAWSPSYLLSGPTPVLFESGFYCMGKMYERDIRQIVGTADPEYLFLSHVHYDHCGATSYFKRCFPHLKVAASARAAEILRRPNARKLIEFLSNNVEVLITKADEIDKDMIIHQPFECFEIDTILHDGQIVKVGEALTVSVMATPGHTRDLFSFYVPERKILFATESAGVLGQTGHIVSEFLVDYDGYIDSLKRLASLDVDVLCQGHHFVFTGDEVKEFFERSLKASEQFKSHVEDLLAIHDGSVEPVVSIIKAEEYDTNPGPKQPEKAYLLNLRTRVAHLAQRAKM